MHTAIFGKGYPHPQLDQITARLYRVPLFLL